MSKDSRKTSNMSIEDILKSIRKIIDNRSGNKEDKPANDEVLELTSMVKEKDSQLESEDLSMELEEERLISDKSAMEVSGILKEFADKAGSAIKDGKKKSLTLEEIVIEMLRPQLKKWLNDNLPSIVQQLVEKEIKRLIPEEE